ncbi:MAG: glycine/sarcosine/betaine reductase complex component C subunit beta, partial [Candidatus Adiutrix sp.]
MIHAAIKSCSYCLAFTPELAFHYGNTPYMERLTKLQSEFLQNLANKAQSYDDALRYAPNLTYIGAMTPEELALYPTPWVENLANSPVRDGEFGEIMPEDEFLALLDFCDVFDLIWLSDDFASYIKPKLKARNFWTQ